MPIQFSLLVHVYEGPNEYKGTPYCILFSILEEFYPRMDKKAQEMPPLEALCKKICLQTHRCKRHIIYSNSSGNDTLSVCSDSVLTLYQVSARFAIIFVVFVLVLMFTHWFPWDKDYNINSL